MFQRVRSEHGYDIRQSLHLYIPQIKTNLGKCKLGYRWPIVWNRILAVQINPETSEAVFNKILKQCIKFGLLRWSISMLTTTVNGRNGVMSLQNYHALLHEFNVSYNNHHFENMYNLIFFNHILRFLIFAQLHLAELYIFLYTCIFLCESDMDLLSMFGFHTLFAMRTIFHISDLVLYMWHVYVRIIARIMVAPFVMCVT